MQNPLAGVLPAQMHFLNLQGGQIVFLLGLMIFFGSFGGRLFQKLKIPQVVGYIVIGIIIGSSGFKILGDKLINSLDPINTIALSLIGFLVGAELKIDVIKKYGKQFIGILLGETTVPFFVVAVLVGGATFIITKNTTYSLSLGLLLGAICTATAPAATTDVLKEYRTKGPVTTTTLGIVAMDDGFALVAYTIATAIASPLLEGRSVPVLAQLGSIAFEIFGSIALGLVIGFILTKIITGMMSDDARVLGFSLGLLFLSTGICSLAHFTAGPVLLKFDHIMAAMTIGFYVTNFSLPKVKNMFKLVDKYTPPIYVLFFVNVGAKLNVWQLKPLFIVIAILYIGGRTLGKTIGSRLGARLTKAPDTVRKYLPYCLLSQAGVAIGLSTSAGRDFADTIGGEIMLIITATTFIVQIIGPICVRYGITKAGEAGLDVTAEDLIKTTLVKDVEVEGEKICSPDNYAIVNETDMVGQIINSFSQHSNMNYAVRGSDGKIAGQISLEHIKEAMQIGEMGSYMLSMDIMDKPALTCTPDTPLPETYKLFDDYDTDAISIVDKDGKPLGILEKYAVDHYLHQRIVALEHKLAAMA
ncbi:cation:proton antiporter domain-containing protein [Treponema berlinense]|uniref:cation:proton antiporter domain-containing protein n=1 Tax=Treponema berlinense TaxID=225004 RepID=UPI003FD73C47